MPFVLSILFSVLWITVNVILKLYFLISPYFKFGVPVILIGLIAALLGLQFEWAWLWTFGASLLLIGIGILVKYLLLSRGTRQEIADRVGFTLMGVLVLGFWALPFDALNWLTGEIDGGIEMFIFSGVFMVASSVWILMYNADILIAAIQGTIGRVNRLRPILKPAIAYPTSSRFPHRAYRGDVRSSDLHDDGVRHPQQPDRQCCQYT